jgi:transcriptional regulator with XRE-family HTH domain
VNLKEIGEVLHTRRNFLKLRQGDIAEITNITVRTLHSIENGTGNPSLTTLQKIADVLGMELVIQIKDLEHG